MIPSPSQILGGHYHLRKIISGMNYGYKASLTEVRDGHLVLVIRERPEQFHPTFDDE